LIYTNDVHILFLRYGEKWRLLRKIMQRLLNVSVVDDLLPVQNAEAIATLHDILREPDNWSASSSFVQIDLANVSQV
jgi:cytochrome P450